MGAALVCCFTVGHGADDRDFVGHLGKVLEVLAKLDALDSCVDGAKRPAVLHRGVRLRIEGIDVARATPQPEQDHRFRPGPALGGLDFAQAAAKCRNSGYEQPQY